MMKKSERTLYISIIIIQTVLIVFSFIMSQKTRKQAGHTRSNLRLCSFYGQDDAGEKKLVHFTAYSDKSYIFLVLSENCGHCEHYLDNLHILRDRALENKNIELIVLMEKPGAKIEAAAQYAKALQVSRDDRYQFGPQTPALLAVNGKGAILFKYIGYQEGLFEYAWEKLLNITRPKSKRIE